MYSTLTWANKTEPLLWYRFNLCPMPQLSPDRQLACCHTNTNFASVWPRQPFELVVCISLDGDTSRSLKNFKTFPYSVVLCDNEVLWKLFMISEWFCWVVSKSCARDKWIFDLPGVFVVSIIKSYVFCANVWQCFIILNRLFTCSFSSTS